MKDELKSKFFKDLLGYETFEAQLALEEETYTSLLKKLLSIDLSKSDVQLEYAKLRGSLDVLQSLKTTRERLAEQARSRSQNS
jgi:hypothetical protein